MTPPDLARLRRIWPAIVRAKGGWPPEPIGTVELAVPKSSIDMRPECSGIGAFGRIGDVPDLTLPGTRAAVLAWLGLKTWDMPIDSYQYMGDLRVNVRLPKEHTPATALAALERWAKEHAG